MNNENTNPTNTEVTSGVDEALKKETVTEVVNPSSIPVMNQSDVNIENTTNSQTEIQSVQTQEEKPVTIKKENKLLPIIIIVGIIAAIGVGIYFIFFTDKDEEDVLPPIKDDVVSIPPSMGDNWKNGEFTLDNTTIQIYGDYSELEKLGWKVDFVANNIADTKINNNATTEKYALINDSNNTAKVEISFINGNMQPALIKDCQIRYISIKNSQSTTPVDFSLPGEIKTGTTTDQLKEKYGLPNESNIKRNETLKYTIYTYSVDGGVTLNLTVYDDGGLKDFEYWM